MRSRINSHPVNMTGRSSTRDRVSSQPFAAKVDGLYYSYATGNCQTAQVNDPSTDNYVPRARFKHCAALWDDKWYVLGGAQHTPACVEEYDTLHETWHQHITKGDIPVASVGVACTALGAKLYTFAGSTSDNKFTNTLSELDTGSMEWRALNPGQTHHAPILKRDAAMIAHGRTLVTFGGYGTYLEVMNRMRAGYDNSGVKFEVWTNELIVCDLDKSKVELRGD